MTLSGHLILRRILARLAASARQSRTTVATRHRPQRHALPRSYFCPLSVRRSVMRAAGESGLRSAHTRTLIRWRCRISCQSKFTLSNVWTAIDLT